MIKLPLLTPTYRYNAVIYNSHDGDTVSVCLDLNRPFRIADVDFGFSIYVESKRLRHHDDVRLLGLNAPELATLEGQEALVYLRGWLKEHCKVVQHRGEPGYAVKVQTVKDRAEKYGRLLATLYGTKRGKTTVSLNADLLRTKHAVVM